MVSCGNYSSLVVATDNTKWWAWNCVGIKLYWNRQWAIFGPRAFVWGPLNYRGIALTYSWFPSKYRAVGTSQLRHLSASWPQKGRATYEIGEFRKNKDLPCLTLLFFCWQHLAPRGWEFSSTFSGAHSSSGRISKSIWFTASVSGVSFYPESLAVTCNLAFSSDRSISWPPSVLVFYFISL